jgi:dolichol kinase
MTDFKTEEASTYTAPIVLTATMRARREDMRQLLHMGLGLLALAVYPKILFGPWNNEVLATCAVISVLALPALRKWKYSGMLFRPDEPFRGGPFYYALGVALILIVLPPKSAMVGWLALAFGDSAANLIGRRWPVVHYRNSRSLGGSIACFAATFIAVGLALMWWYEGLRWVPWGAVCAVALVTALVEGFTRGINDNIVIPIVAAGLFYALTNLLP